MKHKFNFIPNRARVAHTDKGVGYIEDPGDGYMCDVRWLTPGNEPSVLTSAVWCDELIQVPDSVRPMPKSEQWHAESKALFDALERAVKEMLP